MQRAPVGRVLVAILGIGVLPFLQQLVEPRLPLRLELALAGRIGDEGFLNWALGQAARFHQPDVKVGRGIAATIRRHLDAKLEWAAENISKSDDYDPADEVDWAYMMRELGYDGELFLLFEEGRGGL